MNLWQACWAGDLLLVARDEVLNEVKSGDAALRSIECYRCLLSDSRSLLVVRCTACARTRSSLDTWHNARCGAACFAGAALFYHAEIHRAGCGLVRPKRTGCWADAPSYGPAILD